jgi:hypothetical protein
MSPTPDRRPGRAAADPAPTAPAKRGPTWTRARLERVMALRFGVTSASGAKSSNSSVKSPTVTVDVAAVAAEMGVTPRTVQRWLRAPHARSKPAIPPARLAQLLDLLLPSEETRGRETQQARYAEAAIAGFHLPRRMGIKPAWEAQQWLEQHLVVVLEVPLRGRMSIRQITLGRNSVSKLTEFQRRGKIIDQAVVPSRFHATLLVQRVLTEIGPWRYQAAGKQVRQGFTWTWTSDAPATHLSWWSDELPSQRPPQPRPTPTPGAKKNSAPAKEAQAATAGADVEPTLFDLGEPVESAEDPLSPDSPTDHLPR